MSCQVALLQGGNPEIFPIPIKMLRAVSDDGLKAMASALGTKSPKPPVEPYAGASLRPDGSPFYLATVAPSLEAALVGVWQGAFYAPFGVGNIVGTVLGDPGATDIVTITVNAELRVDGKEHVKVEWVMIGQKATTPNKAALIKSISIPNPGPHDPDDIRRCIALHGPQRSFGEPRAIVAMQCGVAAACLIEAIC
jgi:hypothetical protein